MLKLKIQLFAEDPVEETVSALDAQYLDQIDKLKTQIDGMVKGEEYDKLLAEHKKLTDDYINRRPAPKKEEVKKESVDVYAKKLKENKFRSNREFIEASLNYREAYMKETGKDPWSDAGDVTEDTTLVANHLKSLLDENESASEFNFRLEQSLVDDPKLLQTLRSKK